jgi:hypothetical protein
MGLRVEGLKGSGFRVEGLLRVERFRVKGKG